MKIISFGSVLAGKGIYIPDLIKEKLVVEPFTMNVFGLPEAWKNKSREGQLLQVLHALHKSWLMVAVKSHHCSLAELYFLDYCFFSHE